MSTESADTIQDFILKDQRNVHIAAALSEAWPRCRERIARTFLDKLSETLLRGLPGWESELGEDYFEVPWANNFFYKPSWDSYWIALQFVKLGRQIQFGVQRDANGIPKRPFSSEILEAVTAIQPSARVWKPWWEAHVFMRTPASNWQEPEVLWRMYSDPSFLTDVSEQMLAIARAVEPILDRLTKKKR